MVVAIAQKLLQLGPQDLWQLLSPHEDGIHTGNSHHLRPFLIAVFGAFSRFWYFGNFGTRNAFCRFQQKRSTRNGLKYHFGARPQYQEQLSCCLDSWARAQGASPRARRFSLFGLYWVFLCFSEIRQKRLEPLNIRNACGERLEKRSLHPPPVPARDLPLGVWAYNRYLAWSPRPGHSRGAHAGSHIQKKRQRNTAETPLVIFLKNNTKLKRKRKCQKIPPLMYSRVDQHIKDEPCAKQRALLGVFSSRYSSVSRGHQIMQSIFNTTPLVHVLVDSIHY